MYPAGAPHGDAHIPVDMDKIIGGSNLLGQVRDLIRRKHYSIRTEQAYLEWVKRYILFHGKRHPNEMGEPQIVAFLNHLAVERKVAASTQNQALNALERKYPKAATQWGWQYPFSAGNNAVDPRSGKTRRHHLGESAVQRAVQKAIFAAGIHKHGSCHTLRHYSQPIY